MKSENMGKRKLAYEIKKEQKKHIICIINFESKPEANYRIRKNLQNNR